MAAFNSWLAHRLRGWARSWRSSRTFGEPPGAPGRAGRGTPPASFRRPEQSLAALGSIGAAGVVLSQVADPELRACLAWVVTEPDIDEERDRTASYAGMGASTSAGTRFQILRPHARGGLGEVFVALDTDLHREVALKEIQTQFVDDPRTVSGSSSRQS